MKTSVSNAGATTFQNQCTVNYSTGLLCCTINFNILVLVEYFIDLTTASKTAKIKKVILLNNTATFGDVLLGNITFFDFCSFRCVTHYVAGNICINCSFFTIIHSKPVSIILNASRSHRRTAAAKRLSPEVLCRPTWNEVT